MFIFAASLRNFMLDIKTPQDHIILVPMDFSDSSINAVYYAVEVANFFDSEITLLHVLSKSTLSGLFSSESEIVILRDKVRKKLEDFKSEILKKWPNLKVNTLLSEGKPFKVINKVAMDNKCDTIVMGTNGANGIEQFTYRICLSMLMVKILLSMMVLLYKLFHLIKLCISYSLTQSVLNI